MVTLAGLVTHSSFVEPICHLPFDPTSTLMYLPYVQFSFGLSLFSKSRSREGVQREITPRSNFQALLRPVKRCLKSGLVQANLSSSSSGFLCPFICSCLAAGETCSTLTSGHSSNQLAICRKSLHNSDIFPPRQ